MYTQCRFMWSTINISNYSPDIQFKDLFVYKNKLLLLQGIFSQSGAGITFYIMSVMKKKG